MKQKLNFNNALELLLRGEKIVLKNVRDCEKVRKLLRDSIEEDVMERKITYFDKE